MTPVLIVEVQYVQERRKQRLRPHKNFHDSN